MNVDERDALKAAIAVLERYKYTTLAGSLRDVLVEESFVGLL